jgi:hypothetical protein
MAAYITALDYDRARLQSPTHVSKISLREREYNSANNTWGNNQGSAFTVERPMPAPYKMTIKLDIWTSNTVQKLQILEQILPLFNPDFEIQSTDNYLDWASLTYVLLTNTSWSSRQIPNSADNTMDIATLTFEIPIWISLPARVNKLGVVQKMINSVFNVDGGINSALTDITGNDHLVRKAFSPSSYGVVYMGNTVQLYKQNDVVVDNMDGTSVVPNSAIISSWHTLVSLLGSHLVNGTSELRLTQPNGNDIVGTVAYHPTDDSLLLFTPFTNSLPSNTMEPISAIIDPYNINADSVALNQPIGTKYLILNAIGSTINDIVENNSAIAWQGVNSSNLVANANDIIQYNGTFWEVVFDSQNTNTVHYLTNLTSGLQFKWDPANQTWLKSVEGKYDALDWTLILSAQ